MARIAGINIPMNKHVVIGLTHIFGIGNARATRICDAAGVKYHVKVKDLTDAEVVQHWREAWRVTRDAMFICDLHRNAGFYSLLWPALSLMGTGAKLREDGMISIKRGFRRREWRALAARAEIPSPKVWLYYGTRIVLQARKGAR